MKDDKLVREVTNGWADFAKMLRKPKNISWVPFLKMQLFPGQVAGEANLVVS